MRLIDCSLRDIKSTGPERGGILFSANRLNKCQVENLFYIGQPPLQFFCGDTTGRTFVIGALSSPPTTGYHGAMYQLCHYLLISLIVFLTPYAAAGGVSRSELQQQLGALLDNASVNTRSTICLKIIDVTTGEVLFDRHGDRLLTPASNLKIYTAACALNKFGPEKRFETSLMATARIDNGTLHGDLVLVGGGDSMLTFMDLEKLVDRAVQEWGLRRVLGRVRVDNSRYGSPLKGPGWMWDDDPADYNMSVTPLMLDFNVLKVQATASASGISTQLIPPSDYPPIRKSVGDRDSQKVQVTRDAFQDEIIVTPGELGAVREEVRLTMHDPGRWAAGVLQKMLTNHGVVVEGADLTVREVQPSTRDRPPLAMQHAGPTLGATISHFLQESENAVGEVLLHEIAIDAGMKQPTWSDGAQTITKWLTDTAGLDPHSFKLVDGSGLSRYNLISADSSVRLLQYMHGHKHFDVFYGSLKTYPVDPDKSEASSSGPQLVHAKPGGMTGVSTISGYVQTLDGDLLAFSLLANGFIGSNAPIVELRDSVWKTLIRY